MFFEPVCEIYASLDQIVKQSVNMLDTPNGVCNLCGANINFTRMFQRKVNEEVTLHYKLRRQSSKSSLNLFYTDI